MVLNSIVKSECSVSVDCYYFCVESWHHDFVTYDYKELRNMTDYDPYDLGCQCTVPINICC